MELSIISFTAKGRMLSEKINHLLGQQLHMHQYCKSEKYLFQGEDGPKCCKESLNDWTKVQFSMGRAILFIGACGIAVRAIAPHLKDKLSDVPVLVMDEAGNYIIPILSGHYGGANELGRMIAEKTGAAAVITTATDINRRFAVDLFAKKNHLVIGDKNAIKKISSSILAGEKVSVAVEGCVKGDIPKELTLVETGSEASVLISPYRRFEWTNVLQLYPKAFVLGIGCRRGKGCAEIEGTVGKQLERLCIPLEAVAKVASADLKKDEAGLCAFAERHGLSFETFSPEALAAVAGEYTASAFVERQLGVDNVCERAAMAASGAGGRLILRKQAENGITLAVAERKWSVSFDEI